LEAFSWSLFSAFATVSVLRQPIVCLGRMNPVRYFHLLDTEGTRAEYYRISAKSCPAESIG
jgi:hypothetical protein